MPVIRCQACGKANPDFLDVCQYCEARLKPLGGLAPAADETLVSAPKPPAAGQPASDTTIPAGNLMDRLRAMGAAGADTPAAAPEPEPEDEPPALDWMSRLRGVQTPGTSSLPNEREAAAEPDWMWAGAAAEPPADTTPAPDMDSGPAWPAPPATLSSAPPAEGAPTGPPETELPDWLQDSTAPPLPAAGPAPAKPRRKMTDWLNALPGGGSAPPPEVDDVPDWLKGLSGAAPEAAPGPTAEAARPASGPLAPTERTAQPSARDETPAWLQTLRGETAADAGASAEPAAPTAHRQQALPAWMRAAPAAPAPAEPDEPPEPAAEPPLPAEPSWTTTTATPSASQRMQALPAWMRSAEREPEPEPEAAPAAPPAPLSAPLSPPASAPVMSAPPPAAPSSDATMPSLASAPLPPADEMPAWLRDIITPAGSAEAPLPAVGATEAPKKKKMTDWLGAAPAPAEVTPAEDDANLPEWLKNLSAGDAPAPEPARDAGPPVPEDDLPAWLRAAAGQPQPAVEDKPLSWPRSTPAAEPGAAQPAEGLPDWLAAMAPATPAAEPAPSPKLDTETLSWLNELSEPGAEAEPSERPAEAVAEPPPVAEPDEADPLGLGTAGPARLAPAWMDELAAASTAPPAPPTQPEIEPTPEAELPEWLRSLRGVPATEEPVGEEMPDWLRALRGLPPRPDEAPMPELMEAMAAIPARPPADDAGLAATPAALPAWLAAMRPVDIEQTVSPEADTYQETLGVLSGMRGVLRAEPVVAQLHKSATPVHKLEVSEAHSASVRLLAELAPVEAPLTARRAGQVRVGALVERWVVFGILAVAILLAQFQFPGLFAPPDRISEDTLNAYQAVADLAAQSGAAGTAPAPLLIALDYEAGKQGELNPAVRAIIVQALTQGNPVVAVSVRPEGAAVAQALWTEIAAGLPQAEYGTQFVNLGYIPGGPVGLLQFASAPRSTFNTDFGGGLAEVWAAPALADVDHLDDFGLMVVAAGSAQALRGWVEQALFNAPGVPMLAVVSAGVEPMVRPYLMGPDPQLAGAVAGLAGAAQYERQSGQPGAATALWPALGGGLWAAAFIILAGNVVFGLLGLLRRGRK